MPYINIISEVKSMFCRNCGCELQDNMRFCPSCGATVETETRATSSNLVSYTAPSVVAPVQLNVDSGAEPNMPYAVISQNSKASAPRGLIITGFVLTMTFWLAPIGLILAAVGLAKTNRIEGRPLRGMAIAGVVCGAVFTLMLLLYFVLLYMAFSSANYDYYYNDFEFYKKFYDLFKVIL